MGKATEDLNANGPCLAGKFTGWIDEGSALYIVL